MDHQGDAPDGSPSALLDDRYELGEILAEGDTTVRRARDPRLDREVTVVIYREPQDDDGPWRREIDALAMIDDAHVAPLYDGGHFPGGAYVVLQLAAVRTLPARLASRRPGARQLAHWSAGLAGALAVLHARGIARVDTRPEAVLIGDDGEPRWYRFPDATLAGATAEDRRTDQEALAQLIGGIGTRGEWTTPRAARVTGVVAAATAVLALVMGLAAALHGERPPLASHARPGGASTVRPPQPALPPRLPPVIPTPVPWPATGIRATHPDPSPEPVDARDTPPAAAPSGRQDAARDKQDHSCVPEAFHHDDESVRREGPHSSDGAGNRADDDHSRGADRHAADRS